MKIKVLANISYDSNKFDVFAEATLTYIRKLIEIYNIMQIKDVREIGYAEDSGVSEEDYRLFSIEEPVQDCNTATPDYEIESQFGVGYASELLTKGYMFARRYIWKTIQRCENLAAYTSEELAASCHGLKWCIGNLIYGFYKTVGLGAYLSALKSNESIELDPAIEAWCANHNYKLQDIAEELLGYSKKFVPLVDVASDYSDVWEELFKNLDEDLKDQLCTVSNVIYPCEIVAIGANQIKADDDFIEMLSDRQKDENSLINMYPEALAAAMSKIPVELSSTFSTIDSVLTYDQLTAIGDGKIIYSKDFVKSMQKLKKDREELTSVFGG